MPLLASEKLKKTLLNLPQAPGCYIYRDAAGTILYVGKAKNLRRRVTSYFLRTKDLEPAKQIMVAKIATIEHIVVGNEIEALILESNLIKQHKPPYNVSFKDDKEFKLVKVDFSEPYPKVYTVRKIENDRATYFGPYTDLAALKHTLKFLRKIFPWRTCELPKASEKNPRPCFDYHIGLCMGSCARKTTEVEYNRMIKNLMQFLRGDVEPVVQDLQQQMQAAAKARNFEQAALLRDRIRDITRLIERQKIVSRPNVSMDVIAYVPDKTEGYINLFVVRFGKLLGKENFAIKTGAEASQSEIFSSFIKRYYDRTQSFPKEILVPTVIEERAALELWLGAKAHTKNGRIPISIPARGKNRHLLKLSEENAREFGRMRHIKQLVGAVSPMDTIRRLQKSLGLPHLPKRIEVYDISNIQGTNPTGSMIVFENGESAKQWYRRFGIHSFNTPNDVGMMKEMLRRRLAHIGKKRTSGRGRWPKPDLIVVDGGKPQLGAAVTVLAELKKKIPVVGLAKREEEIFVPGKATPILLDRNSPELYLMQRMRDEAHSFAIGYHRVLRGKSSTRSVLDEVDGLGPKKKKMLIDRYGAVNAIAAAPAQELEKILGKKVATKLREVLL